MGSTASSADPPRTLPNRTPDLEVLCLREIRFEPPGPQRRGLSWASVPRRGAGGAGEAGRGAHEREKTRGTLRWRPAATEARAMEASPCPPPHSALLRCPPSHSPLSPCFLAPVSAPVSLLPHPYPPCSLGPPPSPRGPALLLPRPCHPSTPPLSGVSKIGSSDRQAAERQVRDWPGQGAVWP